MKIVFVDSVLGQNNVEFKYIRQPHVDYFLTGRERPGQKHSLCFFLVVEGNRCWIVQYDIQSDLMVFAEGKGERPFAEVIANPF